MKTNGSERFIALVSRKVRKARRTSRYEVPYDALEQRCLMAAHTLTVDDDLAQLPTAQFSGADGIKLAIAAAAPGDTIKVYAGTYEGGIIVDKRLTILGSQPGKKSPQPTSIVELGLAAPDPYGFNIQADDVTISGFTVQDDGDDGDPTNASGIVTDNVHSGAKITGNTFQSLSLGVFLNSNGANTMEVSGNKFIDNNQAGASSGNGIYSDTGLSNAKIVGNFFTGNDNAAITLLDGVVPTVAPSFNIQIVGNSSVDNGPLVIAAFMHDSQIVGNSSLRSSGSGIFFGGNVDHVLVSLNKIEDSAFTGINLNYDPANYLTTAPDTFNRITFNKVTGSGDGGIRLRNGASDNEVSFNIVRDNGLLGAGADSPNGIALEGPGPAGELTQRNTVSRNIVEGNFNNGIAGIGATNNTIEWNVVMRNGTAGVGSGIHLDAASVDNLVANNVVLHNEEWDLFDESVGGATAGTANTWRRNIAKTASPAGLRG